MCLCLGSAIRNGRSFSTASQQSQAAVTKAIDSLLDSKDVLTLERAVAAAAYMRIKEVKPKVDALENRRGYESHSGST